MQQARKLYDEAIVNRCLPHAGGRCQQDNKGINAAYQ